MAETCSYCGEKGHTIQQCPKWKLEETSSSHDLKEVERLIADVIVAGVSTAREHREEYRRLQEEIKRLEAQIVNQRRTLERLEGFLREYGDTERRASIELLNMRIKWAESDLERYRNAKRMLETHHKELIEALYKCGIALKEERLV